MGGLNDEQEGQGKREENGGVGYKKKVAEATLESPDFVNAPPKLKMVF